MGFPRAVNLTFEISSMSSFVGSVVHGGNGGNLHISLSVVGHPGRDVFGHKINPKHRRDVDGGDVGRKKDT